MNNPKISVIIPAYNEADKISTCLDALLNQSIIPFEIIVVDGHSTDGTVENAKKFPVKVVYEDCHTRGGARQVGIDNAEGEYVAFTDASCIPHKDWLHNLVNEFHDDIVGVGGKTIPRNQGFWPHSIDLAFSTFLGSANSIQGRIFDHKRVVNSI
ncbi:MAG: glycosyltransferase family A protein, partial [Chloroflexi bacterium]|nr:glycosyltransferase family A protein [Chloroflexota bacterium]